MIAPTEVAVRSSAGHYSVLIGPQVLSALPNTLTRLGLGRTPIVIASTRAWELHHAALAGIATRESAIVVPDGERYKSLTSLARIYDALVERHADRSSVLIAFGGGVVGDLAGFAAATYLRGVAFVQIPTTLLAQVDSAVGGKVGVNHRLGKNLVGAFYSPRLVAADTGVLATLPRREFRAGLYEVIKYGVIADPDLLARVERTLPALFDREPEPLTEVIATSCRIKGEVVGADERESKLRRILNFGHTIGHALEAVTRYRRFRHGEAVGYGMLAALALGVRRGLTPAADQERVTALVATLGPLPPVADLSTKELLAAVARDKKVVAGTLHFVAVHGLGTPVELTDVTSRELTGALRAIGVTRQ